MKYYLFSLLTILSTVCMFAQSKRYITIPSNKWEYTEAAAAQTYLTAREDFLIDTVINIYVGKSVSWIFNQYPDTIVIEPKYRYKEYTFKVDTILGRGDKRQILFTTKFPVMNNLAQWFRIKERYVAFPDSSYKSVYDSVGVTTDSTFQCSTWLWYTIFPGAHTANSSGVGRGKFEVLEMNWNRTLTIWMEKITTRSSYSEQQAIIHFQLREEPSTAFVNKFLTP